MPKKLLSVLLAAVMLLSMTVIAFASGTPTVTVTSATAEPGEMVTLNVAVSNNPGINTFSFGFDYDKTKLSLTNVELSSGIPGQFIYAKKAVWFNSSDITTNGNYLKLTFKVLASATAGDAQVKVTYSVGDISNYDEEDINFQIVAGKVTVKGENVTTKSGEITVGTAVSTPGALVAVPVSITKNPGINTFSLGFDYDKNILELVGVSVSDELGGQFTYSKKAVWLNSKDTAYTGEILALSFRVLDGVASGDTSVSVTYKTGDISNYNEEDIYFDIVPGKVTVEAESVYDTSVSIGNVKGRPGETVNVYVSMGKETDVKSMTIYDITYDADKVNLISGEWLSANAVLSDWNQEEGVGVITFKENTKLNGNVFLLKFSINEKAEDSVSQIGFNFKVTAQNADKVEKNLSVKVVPGTITINNMLRGDVNGDTFVDSNDAIYLLYHTLLPERYEINQNGDFDGDGFVNSNDAIYLLYFTLLPERYPLA